jgi:hypothetical protein
MNDTCATRSVNEKSAHGDASLERPKRETSSHPRQRFRIQNAIWHSRWPLASSEKMAILPDARPGKFCRAQRPAATTQRPAEAIMGSGSTRSCNSPSVMNSIQLIASLEQFPQILPVVLATVDAEQARWKPANGNWSILEVVCHLADEESEDFRPRLKAVLSDPKTPWSSIHPAEAARERKYNEQDFPRAIKRFLDERAASLRWLQGLKRPDWSAVHEHPKLGPISAGDLLGSWAAHDLLHLRQITKRLFETITLAAQPYKTQYAGTWTA